MRKILISVMMLNFLVVHAFSQTFLNELWKEIRLESKTIEGTQNDNVRKLESLGYRVYQVPETTNKVLRQLLVIDSRLLTHRNNLIAKVATIKNASLIDSIMKNSDVAFYQYDKYEQDIVSLYHYIRDDQVDEIRKSYYGAFNNQTVDYYFGQLYECLRTEDSIANRMKKLLNDKRIVMEAKQKEELAAAKAEQDKIRKRQAEVHEQNERLKRELIESRKREEEATDKERIARTNLPTKEAVRALYRNYTHRSGHVFEMFPNGFIPTNNEGVDEYVTLFGVSYKSKYRESDPSGQMNSLVIKFFESGHIMEVMVFDGHDIMYNAKYSDAASKPYEIRAYTKGRKYYSVLKREYDFDAKRVVEAFSYQDITTGFWVR